MTKGTAVRLRLRFIVSLTWRSLAFLSTFLCPERLIVRFIIGDNYFLKLKQILFVLLTGLASVASAETTGREKVQVGREQRRDDVVSQQVR